MQFKGTVGELFCGAGGTALGAHMAGWKTVWAVEKSKWACATFKRNIGLEPICQDAREVDYSKLPAIDCLAFGFPCDDFTPLGRRQLQMEGPNGRLFECAVGVLRALKPVVAIGENVPGLTKNPDNLQIITQAIEAEGYSCQTYLVNAVHYGVPQHRRRLLFLASRKDVAGLSVRWVPFERSESVSGVESITGIPASAANLQVSQNTKEQDQYHLVPVNGNGYKRGITKYSYAYQRLPTKGPSPTIAGHDFILHHTAPRLLFNREKARLQSFPDDFVFEGSPNSVCYQIGAAVPPRLARAAFASIRFDEGPCLTQAYKMPDLLGDVGVGASVAPMPLSFDALEPAYAYPEQIAVRSI